MRFYIIFILILFSSLEEEISNEIMMFINLKELKQNYLLINNKQVKQSLWILLSSFINYRIKKITVFPKISFYRADNHKLLSHKRMLFS